MAIRKSRVYTQDDGSKVSFDFDGGELVGVKKDGASVRPDSTDFINLSLSDDALGAYNVSKYSSNKRSYEDSISIASTEERFNYFNTESKKETNEEKEISPQEKVTSRHVATDNFGLGDEFSEYKRSDKKLAYAGVLAYPLDIDPQQDHLKISKFKYERTGINASKPFLSTKEVKSTTYTKKRKSGKIDSSKTKTYTRDVYNNSAGGSVKGMERQGSVILPMPKIVDTNGAEWGESKLNIFGLAAVGLGAPLGKLGQSEEDQESIKKIQDSLRKDKGMGSSSLRDVSGALGASAFSQAAATLANQNIDQNTFLARTGGKVLNPNAELLFQGPVLRDFNFDFLMIARSREEGEEIRRIIRWFKIGAAPKFSNSTFLKTPDVFSLEYKRGQGPMDQLDTVNRFHDTMALRTIAVDYAPNGYWSAYQDSQPIAVRMSLNFAELRPVYETDQMRTPESSVGL